ncbi:uncharacterized protein LOC135499386 [Lineus longissimus]|uniref:uncharacterized protein LOC135499386 n=1 Tax=Lineus longissimus TaxID=88925 RepID=UPI00315C5125
MYYQIRAKAWEDTAIPASHNIPQATCFAPNVRESSTPYAAQHKGCRCFVEPSTPCANQASCIGCFPDSCGRRQSKSSACGCRCFTVTSTMAVVISRKSSDCGCHCFTATSTTTVITNH